MKGGGSLMDEMEVEIFRAGDYGDKGTWGERELEAIAADYDPALHEAPVTMDHAQSGPALGWVASVRKVGDRLVARLRKLNDRLLDLVRQGAFKKRSVELYPSFEETGRPYLRAVSFLGAAAPEVKGLADPMEAGDGVPLFSDGAQETLSVAMEESSENDQVVENVVMESAKRTPCEAESGAKTDEGFDAMRDRLRGKGCWRPAWEKIGIRGFFGQLAETGEVEMPDGRRLLAEEWFEDFLGHLPGVVSMGEFAGVTQGTAGMAETSPAMGGGVFDNASIKLHQMVMRYRQAHPETSYAEALALCAPRG
jgi:hypothetical protein